MDIISHSTSVVTVCNYRATMKYLVVLCCVLAVAWAETYTDKYDNINIDEIMGNERLLNAYVDCMLERGPCTAEGKELKAHLSDAIETGCAKCTEAQEKGATKVIDFLIKNKLQVWRELCAKYDPEGKWRKKYEQRARENGIEIPE